MKISGLNKERLEELQKLYDKHSNDPVILTINQILDLVKMSWAGELKENINNE